MVIKSEAKIQLSIAFTMVAVTVYILSHVLPTEAKVDHHETQIQQIDARVYKILEDTQYIRGKVDEVNIIKRGKQ